MDDERVTCEICMEKYDKQKHIPKRAKCCNKVFCLPCLDDIYQRNNQSILCPICRKVTNVKPSNLETDNTVFGVFIGCLKCKKQITKNEINISFDSRDLCCVNCGKNDMLLSDFLGYLEVDLSDFINECNHIKLQNVLEQKIKTKLNDLFNPIIEGLKKEILTKIIQEIKQKFQYDIINDSKKFVNYVNELKLLHETMSSFVSNANEKVNLNNLQQNIKYYSQHFEEIKNEKGKAENINSLIDSSELFYLQQNIPVPEIKNFFLNILETFTSDHKTEDAITGINYFDNKILQLQIENSELKQEISKLKSNKNNPSSFQSYHSQDYSVFNWMDKKNFDLDNY